MKDNDYLKMLIGQRNGNTEPEKKDLPGPINEKQGLFDNISGITARWEKDINYWQLKAASSTGAEKHTALGFVAAIKDCLKDIKKSMKQ